MTNTWTIAVTMSTHDALQRGITALPLWPGGPDCTYVHLAADAADTDSAAMCLAAQFAGAVWDRMPTSTTLLSWPTDF